MVVVFDDIHWGEATFLDLVEHLADGMRDVPILLICLARPELLDLRPGWGGGKLNATTTLLEPLSEDECGLLIREPRRTRRTGRGGRGENRWRLPQGNPLFVEEMLAMLIDDGLLVGENGRRTVNGRHLGGTRTADDPGASRHPPRPTRRERASRDRSGRRRWQSVLRGSRRRPCPAGLVAAVPGALASLTRKDLIRPERSSLGEQTYHFRHLLIRDAAYESIPKETRAELHEGFGRWLDRTAGGRALEHDEVVGYHLEQAYRYRTVRPDGRYGTGDRARGRRAARQCGTTCVSPQRRSGGGEPDLTGCSAVAAP